MELQPIVQVQQGQLSGLVESNINGNKFLAFRGIPYARPPTGNLRFKDPEPPTSWPGVKDATQFGNRCAQVDWMTKTIVGSDDCLFLNVYTPSLSAPAPRAVMVWIHGGGFIYGSGDDDIYGPDHLMERDVVLVTINYRVGVLGFLNVENEIASGNQGLKDQVMALEWVQQNISQFTGDPDNVTIFGESAGAAAVHYLALSPLSQGLFHKIILQSGVVSNPWASVPRSPKAAVQRLSAILGREETDPEKLIEHLQTINAHQLIAAERAILANKEKTLLVPSFGPTPDTTSRNPFLPVLLAEAVKNGVNVPCLCGYTKDEGIIILAVTSLNEKSLIDMNSDPERCLFHPASARFLKENNVSVEDIKKIYFEDETISTENIGKLIDLMGDFQFILGIHSFLETQIAKSSAPTYLFKFEYQTDVSIWQRIFGTNFPGICHGDELTGLFYPKLYEVFGKKPAAPGSSDHLCIQRLTELWTTFAKTGNPTPTTTTINPVIWTPIDNPIKYNCLSIGDNLNMSIENNLWRRIKARISKMLDVS